MDDWSLLQRYVREGSSEALDELMRRHLAMVHATALRQVRDAHLAEDVTQAVFIELIRCAPRMSSRVVLGGWLYQATRFTARKTLRSSWRRQKHEAAAMRAEACEMPLDDESKQKLLNVLDEAMGKLSSTDRDALVLRYLQGKSCREVAEAQRVSEGAARQRLSRALAKLRVKIGRHGIEMSVDLLGATMVEAAGHRPSAELMGRVVGAMRHSSAAVKVGIAARILTMARTHPIVAAATVVAIGAGFGGALAHFALSQAALTAQGHSGVLHSGNTPNDTFIAALDAASAGNSDGFLACFHDLTPARKQALRNVADGMGAGTKLRQAVAAKFGDAQAGQLVVSLGLFPPIPDNTIAAIAPAINGNAARLVVPRIGPLMFTKIGGTWKLDPSLVDNGNTVQHFGRLEPLLPEISKVAADVSAGKYQNMHEVKFAMNRAVAKADDTPVPELPPRPAVLGPGQSPKQTIAACIWATRLGDTDATLWCFDNPSAEQREGILRSIKCAGVNKDLRDSIAETFGVGPAFRTALALGMETGLTAKLIDAAPETHEGDTARVDLKGSAFDHMDFIKVGGVWKIDPKIMPPGNPEWVARFDEYYVPAFKQLAIDVKAGKYESPAQLQTAVAKLHTELKGDYEKLNTQNGL